MNEAWQWLLAASGEKMAYRQNMTVITANKSIGKELAIVSLTKFVGLVGVAPTYIKNDGYAQPVEFKLLKGSLN
jgi:hypothetical protein